MLDKRYERYAGMRRDATSQLSQAEIDADDVEDEKITLAISAHKDEIAVASFDTLTHKIRVMQDTPDSSSHHLITTILHQLQPDEVYCSLTAPESLIDAVELFIASVKTNAVLHLNPWKDFAYDPSKSRILQLNLSNIEWSNDLPVTPTATPQSAFQQQSVDMSAMDERSKEIYLSGLINFDFKLSVGAVGCLILTLQRHLAQEAPEAITSACCRVEDLAVVGLETWQVDKVMQIDNDALMALGVFADEQHASMHSNKSKEGLSLFNLLSETKTHSGTQLLQRRLRQPSCDVKVINNRLDAIAILIHPQNVNAVAAMRKSLSKVGKGVNVLHVFNSLKVGKTSYRFFSCLVQLTVLAQEQYEIIASLAVLESKQLILDILTAFDISTCHTTREAIMFAVDFVESKRSRRLIIADGFDDDLDTLRHKYDSIDSLLSQIALQIYDETPPGVAEEINVVYFPQIGYLIAIDVVNNHYEDVEDKDMIGARIGWVYQVVYFKSDRMFELDAHLGDLATMIADRETEIAYDLSQFVLSYTKELSKMAAAIAELDILLALTRISELNSFSKPLIATTPIIRISEGRHPLQEMCVNDFVQNDTFFKKTSETRIRVDDDIDIIESRGTAPSASHTPAPRTPTHQLSSFSATGSDRQTSVQLNNSAMVITGANGSGKSVYLKQVGLIVIMAQIGCYVPAESATIGLVDKLFTRIMCKESSSKMQSAFMIDLAQVTHAMRNATGRSLVLMDEFGKGTLPSDGAGIFAASVNHLVKRGDDCPFVIATTHFHDLWGSGYINMDAPITVAHMRVKSGRDENGKPVLTHLHKLELELSMDSGAFDCALVNNIPAEIVDRGRQLYLLDTLDEVALENLDAEPSEEVLEAQAIMKRFLEWDIQHAYTNNSDPNAIIQHVNDSIIEGVIVFD
ncbi:hypothetical protein E3P92_00878 [Wallemia ichthyophaga]|nr:hypothetical protein E3P92_00878 [Wallemia ichthyophaga]